MKPIRNPFKNRHLARIFDDVLVCARNPKSELYHPDGRQRTGALQRCAFWDGFNGVARSAHASPGTLAWACYRAGQAYRKELAATDPARVPPSAEALEDFAADRRVVCPDFEIRE